MKLCTVCDSHYEDATEVCPNDSAGLYYVGKTPLIGSILAERYKVVSSIGAGSMGVVYRGLQLSTGRDVAIKVLHGAETSTSANVKRFRREARAVSTLNHENIVHLYDFGFMNDEQPYIVTEFVRGKTLAEVLRERKRLTMKEFLPIFRQVCSAIAEAHRLNIIHRDLKPENIILQDPDGWFEATTRATLRSRRVKVVDFGVAKLSSEPNSSFASLTLEGRVCGSPAYMSPEQCKGLDVNEQSDVYSLGVILYEVFCGHRPFSADSVMSLLLMHVNDKPPRPSAVYLDLDIPFRMEELVLKCLVKEPADRPRSVFELWSDYEAIVMGKTKEPNAPSRSHNWIRFTKSQTRLLQEEALKLSAKEESLRPYLLQSTLTLERPQASSTSVPTVKSKYPSVQQIAKISLIVAAVSMLLFVQVDLLIKQNKSKESMTQQAHQLIQDGNLAEALITIERLKKQMRSSGENVNDLDTMYMTVGLKYGQKKDWQNAMESLQRIPARSKYYQEATELFKKYQKLASAENTQ